MAAPRILHVGSGNRFGGIETFLCALAGVPATVAEQHFAIVFEAELSTRLGAEGRNVSIIGPARYSRPQQVVQCYRRFRTLVATLQPEAIVFHGLWPYLMLGGVPTSAEKAVWLHGPAIHGHFIDRLVNYRQPSLLIANSNYTAQKSEWLFKKAPRAVIPVTIPAHTTENDIYSHRRIRKQLGTSESSVVILQASRLDAWKGHLTHLKALGRLDQNLDWTCWIAGGPQTEADKSYYSHLQNLAKELGIEARVKFLGERNDVPELMAAADIFCQPNTAPEPYGLALVEAIHAGLPVLSSFMGGPSEFLAEDFATDIPAGDDAFLASELTRLITNGAARRAMSAAAVRKAAQFADASAPVNSLLASLGLKTAASEKEMAVAQC